MLGASSLGKDLIIAGLAMALCTQYPAWLPNTVDSLHDIAAQNAVSWAAIVRDAVVTWRRSCSF